MATIIPYKGKFPKIANDAFIAQNAVIIGDVVIGSKSSIWYNCVIRGDVNHIRIGQETNIQDGTIIHVGTNNGPTIIGDGITIGHKALIHACTLHDYSFIGMNSTVMDYAQIKSYYMVAAGALVTNNKIVEENELWTGVPAKFLRMLKKEEVDYINVSKDRYINLAKEYMY